MAKSQAELFDRLASGPDLYRYEPESLARLNDLVHPKGRVLDVGCGDGAIAAALDGDMVFGFDLSPRCARRCAERRIRAVVADAMKGLPFRSASMDTVYCVDVLHHLDRQWDPVFAELDRVLRPGGHMVIVEPDAQNPFVRWTQAPGSPIRVAPWPNEPAIYVEELLPHLVARDYAVTYSPISIEGVQCVRSVFPLWQRLVKAPWVIAVAWWCRNMPNKFAILAQKRLPEAQIQALPTET